MAKHHGNWNNKQKWGLAKAVIFLALANEEEQPVHISIIRKKTTIKLATSTYLPTLKKLEELGIVKKTPNRYDRKGNETKREFPISTSWELLNSEKAFAKSFEIIYKADNSYNYDDENKRIKNSYLRMYFQSKYFLDNKKFLPKILSHIFGDWTLSDRKLRTAKTEKHAKAFEDASLRTLFYEVVSRAPTLLHLAIKKGKAPFDSYRKEMLVEGLRLSEKTQDREIFNNLVNGFIAYDMVVGNDGFEIGEEIKLNKEEQTVEIGFK